MKAFKTHVSKINNKHFLSIILFWVFIAAQSQEKLWKIDPAHSKIEFSISYFKVGEIKGVFEDYSGSFSNLNGNDLEKSDLNIVIKSASINTNQEKRDAHLKTADFFEASKNPEIKFESTSIAKISDESYEITGNFTMSGITKSLVLSAIYKGSYVHPRFKNQRKFYTISAMIDREEFEVGTKYPPAKIALGKKVKLEATIHIIEE